MDECCESIRSKLPQYRDYIVIDITNQCAIHLKQVNDIPRLYRRTNREVGFDMSMCMRKTFPTRSDTNRPVLSQEQARALKFRI